MPSRQAVRELARQLGTRMPHVRRGDAPWLYNLDDYKRWFPRTGRTFLRYLRRSRMLKVPYQQERGGVLAVVIVPWVSTPNPWYALMIAIGLARRGRRVVLLWDDTGFVENRLDEQNEVIAKVLRYVGRAIPVVRLSDESPSPTGPADSALINDLTAQNLIWRFRGAAQTDSEQPLADRVRASLSWSSSLHTVGARSPRPRLPRDLWRRVWDQRPLPTRGGK